MNIILILSLIVLTSLLDTANQTILKSAINRIDLYIGNIKFVPVFIIKLVRMPRVWLGFFLCTLSLFIWLFILSKADLNFAFSADSMHYIFIAFSSQAILKEKVGTQRWLGTILIVIGITLVTWSNR